MNARLNSSGMPVPDARAESAARARQQQLTKPPGSLGRLEELACWFAARLSSPTPQLSRSEIFVFAADHGVAVRGVSAFPQSVTAQMLGNFANSGAAINVLASLEGCRIEVVDVGVAGDLELPRGVRNERVRPGTRDLFSEAAMTDDELTAALNVGERCAREAVHRGAQLLIAGDMGIANTTAAACLICAFTHALPEDVVGRGTGVDDVGLARKREVVAAALARARAGIGSVASGPVRAASGNVGSGAAPAATGNVGSGAGAAATGNVGSGAGAAATGNVGSGAGAAATGTVASGAGAAATGTVASGAGHAGTDRAATARQLFAHLGGLEIAAMAGLYTEAARNGVPVLLDGYISAAAALAAVRLEPGILPWMLASHRSAERGHSVALQALGLDPLVDLGMRLGEGSGAALTLPIIKAALALHRNMATFAQAGVDGATS